MMEERMFGVSEEGVRLELLSLLSRSNYSSILLSSSPRFGDYRY